MNGPLDPKLNAAWLRGLTRRRMSRRDLLRYAGAGAGTVGLSAILAACGVEGTSQPGQGNGTPEELPPLAGDVVMANWPLYIDRAHGGYPSLEQFTAETDIQMSYKVEINDNEEFFGTDLRQQLAQGQPTGWDIVVLTDWMIAKLIRFGYLEELHHENLPNFAANAGQKFKDPFYDPDNKYSVPWAAGITGIGYNRALTGRDLTSIEDLFDPAFAGHIGMFTEMRDTFNFMFHLLGVEPADATLEDAEAATQKLREQADAGLVRGYYGNDYADQLAGGNLWATMAWSGDVFALQLDEPDLRFIVPEEGGNKWTDNMSIPLGAEHPTDAHAFMDFVYRPDIATQITEWVWYESPVAVVQETIAQHAEERDDDFLRDLATSPYVFPSDEINAKLHGYKLLDEEEEQAWLDLFQSVAQG